MVRLPLAAVLYILLPSTASFAEAPEPLELAKAKAVALNFVAAAFRGDAKTASLFVHPEGQWEVNDHEPLVRSLERWVQGNPQENLAVTEVIFFTRDDLKQLRQQVSERFDDFPGDRLLRGVGDDGEMLVDTGTGGGLDRVPAPVAAHLLETGLGCLVVADRLNDNGPAVPLVVMVFQPTRDEFRLIYIDDQHW